MEKMAYRYDLSHEEMDAIEVRVGNYATEHSPDSDIMGLVVPHYEDVSNFGRTGEQIIFDGMGENYDFSVGMAPNEARSKFLYTIDQRKNLDRPRIIHVKRLVYPNMPEEKSQIFLRTGSWPGLTGIEMVDDRLTAAVPEERAELRGLLEESQLSLSGLRHSLNVATNFTTGRVPKEISLGMFGTLFSYHFLVDFAHNQGVENILAYQNRLASISLARVGAERRHLGGKPYHLPRTAGGYDNNYEAYIIPGTKRNLDIFLGLDSSNDASQLLAATKKAVMQYEQ